MTTTASDSSSPQNAIGIFDSGVGGLSISQYIEQALPNESLIYLADNRYAPYGDMNQEAITKRTIKIANWLVDQNVKAIVIACNTATLAAVRQLRQQVKIPIIGVEPAIKPAVLLSNNQKIGLMVTQATAKNPHFLQLVERYKSNSQVYIHPCPGLVELIEQGQLLNEATEKFIHSLIAPLLDKQIDTLVLGCTHYPFITQLLQNYLREGVKVVETAKPVTEQLIRQLSKFNLLCSGQAPSSTQYFSTKNCSSQSLIFSQLLKSNVIVQSLSLD